MLTRSAAWQPAGGSVIADAGIGGNPIKWLTAWKFYRASKVPTYNAPSKSY